MIKRVFSMALAIALLAVSVFTFPASASADDAIIYNLYEAHSEIYIDLLDGGNTASRTIKFTVPYDGWYIIQTMGFPADDDVGNARTATMTLKDSTNQRIPENGISGRGYGEGKLIHGELSSGEIYTLRLGFSDAEAAGLVITYAEGLFERSAPISRYSHITSFEPDVIEFTFTQSNHQQAQVALVEHSEEGVVDLEVDVYGSPFACAYLLDPRVSDDTGSTMLYSGCTVSLDPGVPYYLVVYLEQGDTPVDFPLTVTVAFTPVG